jgi:tRNA threonylcarbamoyladenosine biosynthesis protein TsaE
MIVTTHSAAETEAIAEQLGARLHPGDLVVLTGELGAGKTTFAKGIARALGARDPVTSPTFTIVQEYGGVTPMAHVDIYRIDRVQELYDIGFEELLDGRVVVVEWGEMIEPLLPGRRVEVRLSMGDDPDTRTIEIRS